MPLWFFPRARFRFLVLLQDDCKVVGLTLSCIPIFSNIFGLLNNVRPFFSLPFSGRNFSWFSLFLVALFPFSRCYLSHFLFLYWAHDLPFTFFLCYSGLQFELGLFIICLFSFFSPFSIGVFFFYLSQWYLYSPPLLLR